MFTSWPLLTPTPILSAGQLHSVGRSDAEEKNTVATAYAPAREAFDSTKVQKKRDSTKQSGHNLLIIKNLERQYNKTTIQDNATRQQEQKLALQDNATRQYNKTMQQDN